jgi:hypothetical protein
MNLIEAAHPIGVRNDGVVCRIEEISVTAIFGLVYDDRRTTIAFYVRMAARVAAISQGEFKSELARAK